MTCLQTVSARLEEALVIVARLCEEGQMSLLDPKHTLSLYRLASRTLDLYVEQPDPSVAGGYIPFDITGASLYLTVKAINAFGAVVLRKTSSPASGITIVSPRGGRAQITFSPSDTAGMTEGVQYVYDLWIKLAGGEQIPLIKLSTLRVLQGVTSI